MGRTPKAFKQEDLLKTESDTLRSMPLMKARVIRDGLERKLLTAHEDWSERLGAVCSAQTGSEAVYVALLSSAKGKDRTSLRTLRTLSVLIAAQERRACQRTHTTTQPHS